MSAIREHYIYPIWQRLKKSSLFKDSMWSLIGSAVGRGLSLIAGILVARFLGKDLYGEYGIIKTTLIYIEIFSTFGLGYTATKYIADYKKGKQSLIPSVCKATLNITLATSGFMALLVLIFAEQIAVLIDAPHLYNTLRITAAGIIVNAINIAQIGILSGFAEFKLIAKNTTIAGVITFILTVLLTYYWGLNGAVLALVLSCGTQCLLNNVSVRKIEKQYGNSVGSQKQLYKELLTFSCPIALQESLYSVINWFISFMLIKMCGYGELGLYSAAAQWAAIISFIPGILRNVTLSHLSSSMGDSKSHNKTMRAMLLVNFATPSLMFFFVLLFNGLICSFYGSTFVGLRAVLLVQALCAIVISTSNVYVQEFMSRGKNWTVLVCKILRDAGVLLVAYLIINYYQSSGALVLSASMLVMNIVYMIALAMFYRYLVEEN